MDPMKWCDNCLYFDVLDEQTPCSNCFDYGMWKHTDPKPDTIHHPLHYTVFAIEPLDFILANDLEYAEGNVIKYICRYPYKGGLEDLLKARQYVNKLIDKWEADNVQRPEE